MSLRAGWYPAPDDHSQLRYWDGDEWTEHYRASPDAPPTAEESTEAHAAQWLPDVFGQDDVSADDSSVSEDEAADDSSVSEDEAADDSLVSEDEAADDSSVSEGDGASAAEGESALAWLDEPSSFDAVWEEGRPPRTALKSIFALLLVVGVVIIGSFVFSALRDDAGTGSRASGNGSTDPSGETGVTGTVTTTTVGFTLPTTTRFAIAATTTTSATDPATTTTTTTDGGTSSTVPGSTAPTTTSAAPAERSVTLLVDVAKLRSAPRLNASEVDTITNLAGTTIVAVGEPTNGWYEVRINSKQGWMFGAFIVPPAEGFTVLQTRSGSPVTLLDSNGQALGVASASGSYALATDTTGDLWTVILPEGGTAYVDPADMKTRS